MGMFTEFDFICTVKEDTGEGIDHLIPVFLKKKCYNPNMRTRRWIVPSQIKAWPKHPFFSTARGDSLTTALTFDEDTRVLEVHVYLKDYGSEIQHFLDWIKPYIEDGKPAIARVRYEEAKVPEVWTPTHGVISPAKQEDVVVYDSSWLGWEELVTIAQKTKEEVLVEVSSKLAEMVFDADEPFRQHWFPEYSPFEIARERRSKAND
jgi:hypothetical protein